MKFHAQRLINVREALWYVAMELVQTPVLPLNAKMEVHVHLPEENRSVHALADLKVKTVKIL